MHGSRFGWLVGSAIAALVGFVLLFPDLLMGIVEATGCRRAGGGACGAVAAVAGMFIKPVGVLITSTAITWIASRRIRAVGLGLGWNVAVLLWLLGSFAVLVAFLNFWGANFGLGLIMIQAPKLLLFLLAFVVFLALLPDGDVGTPGGLPSAVWLVAVGAATHALVLSIPNIIAGLALIPFVANTLLLPLVKASLALLPVIKVLALGLPIDLWLWIDLALCVAALAFITVKIDGDAEPSIAPAPAPATRPAGPTSPRLPRVAVATRTAAAPAGFGRRRAT